MNLADLKGVLTRFDSAVERTEAIRDRLNENQQIGLDIIIRNSAEMREGLDHLTRDAPEAVLDAMAKEEMPEHLQERLSMVIDTLNLASTELENWLEAVGA